MRQAPWGPQEAEGAGLSALSQGWSPAPACPTLPLGLFASVVSTSLGRPWSLVFRSLGVCPVPLGEGGRNKGDLGARLPTTWSSGGWSLA